MFPLDSTVFILLYKDHFAHLVNSITRSVGCRETAIELAQETYIRLYVHRDLASVTNLPTYMFRIGHNLAIDYLRSPTGKIESLALDEEQPCPLLQPDELASLRQQCKILFHVISSMPASCRDVFLLRKIDALSYREISARLIISEKTVQRRLVRAMLHSNHHMNHLFP